MSENLLKILVIADPDFSSVTALAEHLIQSSPQYDGIIALGPFVRENQGDDIDVCSNSQFSKRTPENEAMALSDMASIIAQLESIVCRVLYLSGENDPPTTLTQQLYLTPNSVNIHSRKCSLLNDLYIAGFTERSEQFLTHNLADLEDSDDDDSPRRRERDRENPNHSSTKLSEPLKTSVQIIEEILTTNFSPEMNFDELTIMTHKEALPSLREEGDDVRPLTFTSVGIFAFNYRYAHSLSYFLFHMSDVLEQAHVKVCILPELKGVGDVSRLPQVFAGMTIVPVKSLRCDRTFASITLSKSHGFWKMSDVSYSTLVQ